MFNTAEREIVIDRIRIASNWRRVVAIDIDRGHFAAIWGAWDRSSDTIYLYDERSLSDVALPAHAQAIKKRGAWIPALFDLEGRGRSKPEGVAQLNRFVDLQVDVFPVPFDFRAGLDEFRHRPTTGGLKVFSTCTNWIAEYRRYRTDEKGDITEANDHLMMATALLCQFGPEAGITENQSAIEEDEEESDYSESDRNPITGY